jgi:hypothetical protein
MKVLILAIDSFNHHIIRSSDNVSHMKLLWYLKVTQLIYPIRLQHRHFLRLKWLFFQTYHVTIRAMDNLQKIYIHKKICNHTEEHRKMLEKIRPNYVTVTTNFKASFIHEFIKLIQFFDFIYNYNINFDFITY